MLHIRELPMEWLGLCLLKSDAMHIWRGNHAYVLTWPPNKMSRRPVCHSGKNLPVISWQARIHHSTSQKYFIKSGHLFGFIMILDLKKNDLIHLKIRKISFKMNDFIITFAAHSIQLIFQFRRSICWYSQISAFYLIKHSRKKKSKPKLILPFI